MDYDFDHNIFFYLKPILFEKYPKLRKILENKLNSEKFTHTEVLSETFY